MNVWVRERPQVFFFNFIKNPLMKQQPLKQWGIFPQPDVFLICYCNQILPTICQHTPVPLREVPKFALKSRAIQERKKEKKNIRKTISAHHHLNFLMENMVQISTIVLKYDIKQTRCVWFSVEVRYLNTLIEKYKALD